jgi:hypothetical protein
MKHMDDVNKTAFTTWKILNHEAEILLIIHDEDGDWQFLTGQDLNESEAAIVCLKQICDVDCTIESVLDIPEGSVAIRNKKEEEWTIKTP